MVTGRAGRGRRPRVLVVVDTPGWAHDHKTRALRRVLSSRYSMRIRYQHQVGPADVETADLVMVYYWQQLKYRPEIAVACASRRATLLVGICSHVELEGTDRDTGLEVLNRTAGRVFVNSRLLEREFGPLVCTPLHYAPNGVDTTRFRPADRRRVGVAGTLRVGWSGSRSNWPDDHRGIQSVVLPAVEGVHGLDLVLAAREDRWRSHEEMVDLYRSLDVYVCASTSEGTPNPCLEAAACSVPLVTTPVGNMPEFVRDGVNGFLIERSAAALRAALIRLRDDPAGRTRMGAAAR
jgi:glycosyltransferase involved in cell wall biosynthesis